MTRAFTPDTRTMARPGVGVTRIDVAPEGVPDFRRRRSGVCPSLRVDGAPADYVRLADAGVTFGKPGARSDPAFQDAGRAHSFTCAVRRESVGLGWMGDVCASSACRDCPFQPEPERPVVRYRIVMPEYVPPPAPPDMDTLVARVRQAIGGQSMRMLGVAMGHSTTYVRQAIQRETPSSLTAILAYLEAQ